MKLVFVNGEEKGRELELKPPFISLGRETDNDVVLRQEQVSRYHAKIEKDGSIWIVRDLESSNGVRVNGTKIEESAPLSSRDELRVGDAIFEVIDENAMGPSTGIDLTKKADEQEVTKKDDPAAAEAKQKRIRLLLTAVLTILIIVLAGVFVMDTGGNRKDKGDPVDRKIASLKKAPLRVFYKEEKSGWDPHAKAYNIAFYQIEIKDEKLHVNVSDYKSGVQVKKTEGLTPDEIWELKEELLKGDDLLKESSLPPRERDNRDERVRFLVMAGNRGNYLEYVNEVEQIPSKVREAIQKIRGLAENKVDIRIMSIEEAFELAKDKLVEANRLYNEQRVAPDNLYRSILIAREALALLNSYEKIPDFYQSLQQLKQNAESDHRTQIEQIFKQAQIEERTNPEEALRHYQEILSRITDTDDPDYEKAKPKVYNLKKKLRKGK